MRTIKAVFVACCISAVAAGCSSTFTVAKEGQRGYFFGSTAEGFYKMMCESGELISILNDTSLNREIKDALYKGNCSPERSKERVGELYASLAPEQRKDLRVAFKKHGYEVNYMPC